jgi:DNA-binding transcriptional MerR regulator
MQKNEGLYFTSRHIEAIFKINRKVLLYWRRIGILNPSVKTNGGHYRYSFAELVAVKTIIKLKAAGISTYKIKKTVEELKKVSEIRSPLSEKSFYVIGKEVYVVDKQGDFSPCTGQYSFIFIWSEETKSQVKNLTLDKFDIPQTVKRRAATRR